MSPSRFALLALLGAVPVAAFLAGRTDPSVGLSLACVVVIAASLYYLFGGPEAAPA